jgi:ribosomal protein L11 methyltransferase
MSPADRGTSPADRRWLEVSVRCPSAGDRAPLLADGLVALGGRAIEERAGWYVTHLRHPEDLPDPHDVPNSGDPSGHGGPPEHGDPSRHAAVPDSADLPSPDDGGHFERRARRALAEATGLKGIEVRVAWKEHEDWAETWKRGLGVRRITGRIVVRPSWLEHVPAGPEEIVIVLDPGMAFGTAEHGTTRGCLRLLDRAVRSGERVLDVGAGSGILAVAAARLGAEEVVAIEGDPLAVEAIEENVTANGVADRVRIVGAWAEIPGLLDLGPVDGIVANIETGILTPLFPGLVGALRPGGWLIVSGILGAEWPGVARDLEAAGCHVLDTDVDDEWTSGLLTRRA